MKQYAALRHFVLEHFDTRLVILEAGGVFGYIGTDSVEDFVLDDFCVVKALIHSVETSIHCIKALIHGIETCMNIGGTLVHSSLHKLLDIG